MKPWLKKLDELKAKAIEKKNRITAQRFRQDSLVARHYAEAIERGETHAEATLGAVKKSGSSFRDRGVDIHLRGWLIGLSLDESEDDYKWRWRVSVSQSQIEADPVELREMIEHLGGKFDDPCLTPLRDGTKATHWRWDYVEAEKA